MISELVCYLIGLVVGFVTGMAIKDTKRNDRSVCIMINIYDETKNANDNTKDATDNSVGYKEEEEA